MIFFLQRLNTAEHILSALKQRYSGKPTHNNFQSSREGALKSLDLLRSNIQSVFDKEIDLVVKKFIDTYFVLAVKNVKENLGENCIENDQLKSISISLLEHSKRQYITIEKREMSRNNTQEKTPSQDVETEINADISAVQPSTTVVSI